MSNKHTHIYNKIYEAIWLIICKHWAFVHQDNHLQEWLLVCWQHRHSLQFSTYININNTKIFCCVSSNHWYHPLCDTMFRSCCILPADAAVISSQPFFSKAWNCLSHLSLSMSFSCNQLLLGLQLTIIVIVN